ncbi:MAG: arylsulfotransferase family protein [Streptosporangiales bacterium]|nr:arylsulfotransferase family protein [Streptosporangiales bacterium]
MRKKTWGAGVLAGISVAALTAGVPAASAASTAGAGSSTAAPALPLPPVSVQTDKGGQQGGDIFVAPYGDASTYANGSEILSPDAKKTLWFHQAPSGDEDADFRTQAYDGKPVLTFWEGTGLGGVSTGTDYIYNDKYQKIATVKAGNGYSADGHEFLITPQGTALILSYTTSTANLTSIGGPSDQKVINGLVQEVDIKTGKVLFQWNIADHVPYSESEQPLPASANDPWDWFHINAVKLGTDGNLLIDSRDTWTTFDVSRRTGKVNWQLGGKDSSFRLQAAPGQSLNDAGKIFAWQHDAEDHGNGVYTIFDNESAGTANTGQNALTDYPYSRTDTVKVDFAKRTATLVKSNSQPESQIAPSQGNAQQLADGGQFVGWGSLPYFSEFSPSGRLEFNASFPSGVNSYRAYRLPWYPAR